MNQQLQQIKLSVNGNIDEVLKTIRIVFDDNQSVEIQSILLKWNIPYFDTMLNSNFIEKTYNEFRLPGFSKEIFTNCIYIAMGDTKIFDVIIEQLQNDLTSEEFINIMYILQIYYEKLDYLGVSHACILIEEILNDKIINNSKMINNLVILMNNYKLHNIYIDPLHILDTIDIYKIISNDLSCTIDVSKITLSEYAELLKNKDKYKFNIPDDKLVLLIKNMDEYKFVFDKLNSGFLEYSEKMAILNDNRENILSSMKLVATRNYGEFRNLELEFAEISNKFAIFDVIRTRIVNCMKCIHGNKQKFEH